jgi:NAD(P)-dependent dehydrogenase (short-subunit alcohol dehydrogenase family)
VILMQEFNGKTAVISGGAEGIGLALAKALGACGMNIVIADIEAQPLAAAREALAAAGVAVEAVEMDVAIREDWSRLLEASTTRFGNIHMLINNAGVGGGMGALGSLDESGWRWTIDVNLMGVVYGADTLVPAMQAHGEPSWLINVASMAGMGGVPLAGAYTATKAAVVAMSEAWALELGQSNVRVSVLAPAFVQTRIHESHRNRQPKYAMTTKPGPDLMKMAKATTAAVEGGIEADLLAQRVIEALAAGEFYIFTHPRYRAVTDQRSAAIASAFSAAERSPLVGGVEEAPLSFGFMGDQ